MNQSYLILSACIAVALATASNVVAAATTPAVLTGINTSEEGRVKGVVSDRVRFNIPRSHLDAVGRASAKSPATLASQMNHLQLVLKPSRTRSASMEALIAEQHEPKSPRFHQWLNPEQFGEAFGAVDSDVDAVKDWLIAQGFTVNNVYPNKTEIDFSGTVSQVNKAFKTQENIYSFSSGKHLANATDISVPAAFKEVVAGVMGLNDFHPAKLVKKNRVAQWSNSLKGFVSRSPQKTMVSGHNQAVTFSPRQRGLVPNDMATIYGVRTLRANGVTGAGINIAVVEDNDMVPADWTNFVSTFNLGQFNGTFSQFNPPAPSGTNNCVDPNANAQFGPEDDDETLLDAEWSTAIAPGANIWVATCSDSNAANDGDSTSNFFGGVYLASVNLINAHDAANRPDIISASYGYGEYFTDVASKTAIDLMWAQADAEGISVYVSTGDSGSNPSFNGFIIEGFEGNTAIDANSFATSTHDTGVGGNDFADVLKGTTSQYFAPTPSVVGGSALSYVPEIPWNQSCGNGIAAQAFGFNSAVAFCQEYLKYDPNGDNITAEAGSGGPSSVDAKPAWQRQVFNAAEDQSRDLPDVSLFADSFQNSTAVIVCTASYPCAPGFTTPVELSGGTSLSSPMFAGIQALIDQGLTRNGLSPDQGNAAPTLYALASAEYGSASGPAPASLAACNANNGTSGTSSCVFHNVTTGSISSNCIQQPTHYTTQNCYYYGAAGPGDDPVQYGLTVTDSAPTSYGPVNKAYGARAGWSFASGLGSVNATNLLIAWRAFVNAPRVTVSSAH